MENPTQTPSEPAAQVLPDSSTPQKAPRPAMPQLFESPQTPPPDTEVPKEACTSSTPEAEKYVQIAQLCGVESQNQTPESARFQIPKQTPETPDPIKKESNSAQIEDGPIRFTRFCSDASRSPEPENFIFFVGDTRTGSHFCPWDSNHIETPRRLEIIFKELHKSGELLDGVRPLTPRNASYEEIRMIHTHDWYEKLHSVRGHPATVTEQFSCQYEDLYVSADTFYVASRAAGCAIDLTTCVISEQKNGFAAIRPPGHHAFPKEGCGFCVYNNIALSAKKARQMGVGKILIVDWDVHAGQGTQACIEDDSNIFLVSIHRFEQGTFWPNLPQSAIYNEYKQTVNVPLNALGLTDTDFMAIMEFVVRPLIEIIKPELLLVSCGFDASFGDPEGEMAVTPRGFGCMAQMLVETGLPVAALLEGGYFLDAIGPSAVEVVRALKGQKLEQPPLTNVNQELMKTIVRIQQSCMRRFPGFRILEQAEKARINWDDPEYRGERNAKAPFQTRDIYTPRTEETLMDLRSQLADLMHISTSANWEGKNYYAELKTQFLQDLDTLIKSQSQ